MNVSAARTIPSLDGLRAIAILIVVVAHTTSALRAGLSYDPLAPYEVGRVGVQLFFVISGFLITGLLLREHQRTGQINLRRFYVRRAFRILPAYYAYLLFIAAIEAIHPIVKVSWNALILDAFYLSNWLVNPGSLILHLWSLGVEEQFYLIWPALLLLLGVKRSTGVLIALLIAGPIVRGIAFAGIPVWRTDRAIFSGADFLAVGCLLAIHGPWLRQQKWYHRLRSSAAMLSIPLTVAITYFDRTRAYAYIGASIEAVLLGLTLDWCVANSASIAGRVLNWAPVRYVGVLSYSLYLWHFVWINVQFARSPFRWVPLVVGSTLASYYLIEQPFLRMRDSKTRRVTRGAAPIMT